MATQKESQSRERLALGEFMPPVLLLLLVLRCGHAGVYSLITAALPCTAIYYSPFSADRSSLVRDINLLSHFYNRYGLFFRVGYEGQDDIQAKKNRVLILNIVIHMPHPASGYQLPI